MKNAITKDKFLEFLAELKKEFFLRLKDETQPAKKEFSYVDLLDILDVVTYDYVTKAEREKFDHEYFKGRLDEYMKDLPAFESFYRQALKLFKERENG